MFDTHVIECVIQNEEWLSRFQCCNLHCFEVHDVGNDLVPLPLFSHSPFNQNDQIVSSLNLEVSALRKLLYKNCSQHRKTRYFQHLQEVARLVGLLQAINLERHILVFYEALNIGKRRGTVPGESSLAVRGGELRRIPSLQAAGVNLHRIHTALKYVEYLGPAIFKTAKSLTDQISLTYFMPFCVTALAIIARIRVLTAQFAIEAVCIYNSLAEVTALLPSSGKALWKAPVMLRIDWDSRGCLQVVPVGQEIIEYSRDIPGVAIVVEEQSIKRSDQKAAAATQVLDIIEDFGVAVPRDESILYRSAAPCTYAAGHYEKVCLLSDGMPDCMPEKKTEVDKVVDTQASTGPASKPQPPAVKFISVEVGQKRKCEATKSWEEWLNLGPK